MYSVGIIHIVHYADLWTTHISKHVFIVVQTGLSKSLTLSSEGFSERMVAVSAKPAIGPAAALTAVMLNLV